MLVDFYPSGGASLRRQEGMGSWIEVVEVDGLYVLRTRADLVSKGDGSGAMAVMGDQEAAKKSALWHFRLAHLGVDAVQKLSVQDNCIPRLPEVPRCVCTGCVYGKMTRKPFHPVPPSSRATQVLEMIHSDIASPLDPISLG